MKKRCLLWPTIVVCAALLAAACASDDDTPDTQPAAPSATEEPAAPTAEPDAADEPAAAPAPAEEVDMAEEPAAAPAPAEEPDEVEEPAAAGEEDDGSEFAEFEAALSAAYEGTYRPPPSDAPPLPAEPLDVWWLSCGEFSAYCATGSAAAREAGTSLGWNVTVVDSFADPALAGDLIREAVAAGADAIVVASVDCDGIRGPLGDAEEAGILVVAVTGQFCSDEDPEAPVLYDGAVTYAEGSYTDWFAAAGEAMANWIVVKTDGQARVITVTNDEIVVFQRLVDGFMTRIADCSACVVYEMPIVIADFMEGFQTKTEQALLQHPDANAVVSMGDSVIQLGLGPAILATDGGEDLHVMGFEGLAPSPDLAREGVQQDAGVGQEPDWEAYAAMDVIIRLAAGEEPVSSGMGIQVWDVDYNLPPEGESYRSGIDFVSAYLAAWGVG